MCVTKRILSGVYFIIIGFECLNLASFFNEVSIGELQLLLHLQFFFLLLMLLVGLLFKCRVVPTQSVTEKRQDLSNGSSMDATIAIEDIPSLPVSGNALKYLPDGIKPLAKYAYLFE